MSHLGNTAQRCEKGARGKCPSQSREQKTLHDSFDKSFRAIIFQGLDAPLSIVGFEPMAKINSETPDIVYESSQKEFDNLLSKIDKLLTEQRSPGIFVQRNMRCYIGNIIYVIKPDQRRYWTRSSALRDADEVYAEIMAN